MPSLGFSFRRKIESIATIRAGIPKSQKAHLQPPKAAEIEADDPRAIAVPTEVETVYKLMAIALSFGGNHLKTKADPGANRHPAAKPFANL